MIRLLSFMLAATAVVLAAAFPLVERAASTSIDSAEQFYLRANCPTASWQGRHLVALPTTHQLGLENFTVHPETPPLKFTPVKVTNGNYALQGEGRSDDPAEVPFLAALKSTTGTHTASMIIVYMTRPTEQSNMYFLNACPAGYECVADQWTFDESQTDAVRTNFRFANFNGKWEPFKDAGEEGWHVYWKGNAGLNHPIQLDLAPVD